MSEINKESVNILEENISKLKELFPEVFSEGKIDFDKLKETLGEFVDSNDEKYTFSWAGRQESKKFSLIPSKGTLIPDKERSINFTDTENILIEGENLEVLKLLHPSYSGKIKMIYIDPPYNTGNDFIYNDDFKDNLKSYLEQTGQSKNGIKLKTNLETFGRLHSNWLSFMYPRLTLARELLSDDGCIFISIDDNEIENLKILLNDIFDSDNFLGQVIVKANPGGRDYDPIATQHEYLFVYSKDESEFEKLNDLDVGKNYPMLIH